jgi:hypothetical protein
MVTPAGIVPDVPQRVSASRELTPVLVGPRTDPGYGGEDVASLYTGDGGGIDRSCVAPA